MEKKEICKVIRNFIEEISHVEIEDYEISLFTFSLGLKSYDVVELLYKLEDAYHIPVKKFYKADKKFISIANLAEGIINAIKPEDVCLTRA